MSIGAITGSGSTANLIDAIKALRSGAVAATQAVSSQVDPRVNAEVEEQSSTQQRKAFEAKADQRRQALDTDRRQAAQENIPRPSSAFLTQALAQEQDDADAAAEKVAATVAGSAAYGSTAYADAASRASTLSGRSRRDTEYEILSPNPSASSGRGIDLSV